MPYFQLALRPDLRQGMNKKSLIVLQAITCRKQIFNLSPTCSERDRPLVFATIKATNLIYMETFKCGLKTKSRVLEYWFCYDFMVDKKGGLFLSLKK